MILRTLGIVQFIERRLKTCLDFFTNGKCLRMYEGLCVCKKNGRLQTQYSRVKSRLKTPMTFFHSHHTFKRAVGLLLECFLLKMLLLLHSLIDKYGSNI